MMTFKTGIYISTDSNAIDCPLADLPDVAVEEDICVAVASPDQQCAVNLPGQ